MRVLVSLAALWWPFKRGRAVGVFVVQARRAFGPPGGGDSFSAGGIYCAMLRLTRSVFPDLRLAGGAICFLAQRCRPSLWGVCFRGWPCVAAESLWGHPGSGDQITSAVLDPIGH